MPLEWAHAMIHTQSFIKISSGIQKLLGAYTYAQTQTAKLSHKPIFIFSKQGK
jgi:hypothetical protein